VSCLIHWYSGSTRTHKTGTSILEGREERERDGGREEGREREKEGERGKGRKGGRERKRRGKGRKGGRERERGTVITSIAAARLNSQMEKLSTHETTYMHVLHVHACMYIHVYMCIGHR
jgi:hypothetical protein